MIIATGFLPLACPTALTASLSPSFFAISLYETVFPWLYILQISAYALLYSLICIAVYGIILYAAAFRKVEGHHFEMALQPEKLLLFFIIEEAFLFFRRKESLQGKKRIQIVL